jgi:hypothetical protein
MIKEQIKEITSSKWNIFIVSISLLPKLTGWTEFFIKFGENIKYVIIIIIIMLLLLAIHQYMKFAGKKQKEDSDNSVNDSNLSLIKKNNKFKFARILTSLIFLIVVFSISFLYFLKDAPVYYLKVSGNLNIQEAITKRNELSNKFNEHDKKDLVPTIRRRSVKNQNKNYFLSINGAYLDKERANIHMKEVKKVLGNKTNIVIITNTTAHITRKLEYLIAHFVPYRVLSSF